MSRGFAFLFSAALGLAALALPQAADAAATSWQHGKGASARLITAVDGTGTLAAVPAGLQIKLDPHWKTYWRSPGDAGLPPALDWAGSANLGTPTLAYPAPHRFQLFGLETYGYETEVVYPLTLPVQQAGQAQHLALAATVLVCSDICIPASFSFSLDLPAGPAAPDPETSNLIDRYDNAVPGDGSAAGLAIGAVTAIAATADAPNGGLRVEATAREPFQSPDIFVEAAPGDAFAAPRVETSDGGRTLVAVIDRVQAGDPAQGDKVAALGGSPVTLTLVDGARSVEAKPTIGTAVAAPVDATAWVTILGVALLGGLILNLMPCVLPVLSLKLLSIVKAGGQTPRRQRLGLLATAAGIVASFLLLAAGAVGLKAAGASVGWGIQFQEPVFLVVMIVILTLFGCNLLGLFEVVLPGRAMDAAARASGADQPTERAGLLGPFLTGAFATLLATPCSAPFVGTALGFALSRGPTEIGLTFAALGLGMALPYLVIAAVPALARLLPRPGRWMLWVKAVLGLALFGTAIWLLFVLSVQVLPAAAIAVAAAMVLIGLTLWLRPRGGPAGRRLGTGLAAVLALAAILLPLRFDRSDAATTALAPVGWTRFDRAAIPGLVGQGKVVFVDVTAEWCLTCQVNKLLVLGRDPVAAALGGNGVVPMLADWTNPDPAIADYLAAHGRYGIPFNAVYGPGAPDGIVLPELLSADAVLDALAKARGAGS